jgi:hypothetical protein
MIAETRPDGRKFLTKRLGMVYRVEARQQAARKPDFGVPKG